MLMLHSQTHTLNPTNTIMSLRQRWTTCRETILGLQQTHHTLTHTGRGVGWLGDVKMEGKEKRKEEAGENSSVLTDEWPGSNFPDLRHCQSCKCCLSRFLQAATRCETYGSSPQSRMLPNHNAAHSNIPLIQMYSDAFL